MSTSNYFNFFVGSGTLGAIHFSMSAPELSASSLSNGCDTLRINYRNNQGIDIKLDQKMS